MKFAFHFVLAAVVIAISAGCSSPSKNVKNIRLGMLPDEVRDAMGEPNTIRAAKVFVDGQVTEVWEYNPWFFEVNPRTVWIYFENMKVVQWGLPGDFAGKSGMNVPVDEYKAFKKVN